MPILVLDLGSSSFFCYFALVERLAIQAIQAMQVWRARLAHQWVSFSIWSSHLPWKHILPVKHPHFHLKKWKIKIEEEKIKNLKLKILPHVHLKRKDRNWKKMKLKILSHHHLPVLCMDGAVEERRPSSFAHVHKFTPFLKPAHRIIGKDKILANVHNASIISCACGDRWDVYITIDESEKPSLRTNFTCKATPILVKVRQGLVYSWQSHVLSWENDSQMPEQLFRHSATPCLWGSQSGRCRHLLAWGLPVSVVSMQRRHGT